jgi:hypothetical protein
MALRSVRQLATRLPALLLWLLWLLWLLLKQLMPTGRRRRRGRQASRLRGRLPAPRSGRHAPD